MKSMWLRVCLVAGCLAEGSAHAVTLQVTNGKLIGATGVNVRGTLYDVTFQDGTCNNLFSGCNSNQDFEFNTLEAAASASEALLDQVLINLVQNQPFDSVPYLTMGCEAYDECWVITPYTLTSDITAAIGRMAINNTSDSFDRVSGAISQRLLDTSAHSHATFAVWSRTLTNSVPEPPSLALMGAGLMAYAASGRYRART
jgi:hypothetical protein